MNTLRMISGTVQGTCIGGVRPSCLDHRDTGPGQAQGLGRRAAAPRREHGRVVCGGPTRAAGGPRGPTVARGAEGGSVLRRGKHEPRWQRSVSAEGCHGRSMSGMLRLLMSLSRAANVRACHCVLRGHLRTNAAGANLNREWANPTLEYSPEARDARAHDLDIDGRHVL